MRNRYSIIDFILLSSNEFSFPEVPKFYNLMQTCIQRDYSSMEHQCKFHILFLRIYLCKPCEITDMHYRAVFV